MQKNNLTDNVTKTPLFSGNESIVSLSDLMIYTHQHFMQETESAGM